jgi:glycosyltransferase involved in cell wall biosynthesis
VSAPRVLVLGTVLGQGVGGVRRHAAELLPRAARLLAAEGGSLAVLEGSRAPALELPPEVERLRAAIPAGPPWRRALVEGRALRRVLDRAAAAGRPFDLVHTAHQPVPRVPCPLAVLVHDLRALEPGHAALPRRLAARVVLSRGLARAAALLAVSEATATALGAHLGIPRERIGVVPDAADHLEPLPRRPGPDAPLLVVGHLEPRKRPELVVRALAADPGLPPVEFLGAARGDAAERLRALARELGVSDRVRLLGEQDEIALREAYASCAAVVAPSALEGFGIVPLEAQVVGAPLAVSDLPAHREVAGEDVPRFGPDPGDCARAVRRALAEAPSVREARRTRALERFSWERSAVELVEAWRAAAGRRA